MLRARSLLLMTIALGLSGVLVAQDKEKKGDSAKAEETKTKVKGYLPAYWKDLGLSDEQKQQVYTVQIKYAEEVDKLESQIKELKSKLAKERLKILTPSQKKKLEDVVKEKVGTGDK